MKVFLYVLSTGLFGEPGLDLPGVHYCLKWTRKVFYELLSQYAWNQKQSDPFSSLLTSRQHDVGHEEIFSI